MISNRFAIHFAILFITTLTGVANFTENEVRAEGFGQKSVFYQILVTDTSATLEEVTAGDSESYIPTGTHYLGSALVVNELKIDSDYVGEPHVSTTVGSSAIVAPTISESSGSVAPRTEIESYVVQEGDTISTIAERYGINTLSILWANQMTAKSYIRPGQTIKIPPVNGVTHTIKKGDTLANIAKTYGVSDLEKIVSFNKLASASDLTVGEMLIIPDGRQPAAPRLAPVSNIFKGSATPRGSSAGRGSWIWPTDWRVITQYFGWKHTGLDIDGDYSTNNYAAASGTVVYSGWRNGYGMTIEVDHGGGLKTRYAHGSKNLVSVGQKVSAGDVLQKTGTTGRSTGTHIHFEVIDNGKFRNPLEFIR